MRSARAASALGLVAALVLPAPLLAAPRQPVSMEEASRFLSQATLGADILHVRYAARVGYERWLERQIAKRPTYHLRLLEQTERRLGGGEDEDPAQLRRIAWFEAVLRGRDVLRQRVALALSEIFVVSDRLDLLGDHPEAIASYYDILVRNALGSYRNLLREVSMSPAMGVYLSHMNNDKSDPSINRFPDENYGREVMQLFSIGLHELNPDGTEKLDEQGEPIATYGNREVREFAKIFTGFGPDGTFTYEDEEGNEITIPAFFGLPFGDFTLPMKMYDAHHEPGEKTLLRGFVVPAGQTGMQDFEMAIDNLSQHPNVGPFIARRLIQRLVTSNPTPAYIERVAGVFADDGEGVRGNLAAVVVAILLDPEARDASGLSDPVQGRLREPFLRIVRLLRTFPLRPPYDLDLSELGYLLGQYPMSSPSVFNFFQPDFAPDSAYREAGLVAPEFQITTSSTSIFWANVALFLAAERELESETGNVERMRLWRELRLARDPDVLIDRLDLLLTHGNLSEGTRAVIADNLDAYEDPELRLIFALYLFLISPDWNVVQ